MVSAAIIYAYHENEWRRDNLRFFLSHGYRRDDNLTFVFVVNGGSTVSFPESDNVVVIRRPDSGFDFGGFNAGMARLSPRAFDAYFFVNASCRGPFLPPRWRNQCWTLPFLRVMRGDTKLVGPTINVHRAGPHVQTYMFAMDRECACRLLAAGFFATECADKESTIREKEIGLSRAVLAAGWNIGCLIEEYAGRDYRAIAENFNPSAEPTGGDMLYPGACFGRTVQPHECIFYKTNRGLAEPPGAA
jgi:hypothetical protein